MAKLFSKEKDIFLKVVNSIFVIWLMIAIVITLGVGIKIFNKDKIVSYKIYSSEKCDLDKIPTEEIDIETAKSTCYSNYVSDKKNIQKFNKENKNNFYIGISNIIIVSIFLHLLNKKVK